MNTMTMKWLLRREFWEHKGSMFWAQAVVGALLVLFVGGTLLYAIAAHGVPAHMTINGHVVSHGTFASALPPEARNEITQTASGMYLAAGLPLYFLMIATIFFYCIGALYNERHDRSILFWKSLPVSDATTVLSKVLTALVVAPLIAMAFGTVVSVVLLLVASTALSMSGWNMFGVLFSSPDLYLAPLRLLALLPVYIVWALPTVGWLLLVSCWARTKPLLWAIGVPLILLLLTKWISYTLANFSDTPLNIMPLAQEIAARLLTGVVPGIWFSFTGGIPAAMHEHAHGPDMGVMFEASWMTLSTAGAWIGAVAGIAMIFGAIRLRRWRDEG